MTTLRFTLKNLEGELLPNTQFKISAGYPDDTYDPELELPANTLFTTDNNGEALVTLAPLSVPYYLTRATDTLDDMIAFKFFVPNSATVLEADFTYVDLGGHLHTLADNSMYTFIETKVTLANAVEQVTISALAAGEAASAAATSASAASSSATAAQTAAESVATEAAVLATDLNTHIDNVNAHSQYHRKDAIANDSDALWCGTAGGTANSLTLSLPGTPVPQVVPVYKAGLRLVFKANVANTGAVVVNFNGLGGKSIVAQSGTALVAGDIKASGVYEIVYDGTAFQIIGFDVVPDTLKVSEGNCILRISAGLLQLTRYRGLFVPISGALHLIPVDGISLDPIVAPEGTQYVYVYNNAGVLSLEVSFTGYTEDVSTGVMVKIGDTSRTLVGMVYRGLMEWAQCRSWFNDPGFVTRTYLTAERPVLYHTTYTEVHGEIRCYFLAWNNEFIRISTHGSIRIDASNQAFYSSISVNGVVQDVFTMANSYATDAIMPLSQTFTTNQVGEGLKYVSIVGKTSLDTYGGHYSGGATPGERTTLEVYSSGLSR